MTEPIKVNKRQHPTEEDKRTRVEYCMSVGCKCELCGETYLLDLHHIFKQQKIYWEDPENYVLLCRHKCHAWVENEGSQLERMLPTIKQIGKRFKGMTADEIKSEIKKNWRECEL